MTCENFGDIRGNEVRPAEADVSISILTLLD
jgi:hypothetical protein